MNEFNQKRQIQRFLKGQDNRDIDAFCIYQWIERCHNQHWWELAIQLSPHITPGSLSTDYQRRLDFIIKDCRIKQDISIVGKVDDLNTYAGGLPRQPVRKIIRNSSQAIAPHQFISLYFDNDAKQTLRQIYSVIYYMKRNYDFVDAVRRTKDNFNVSYQAVDDKCARRFAGTVDIFQRWYSNGEILLRLRNHFHLSRHDYMIFEELLTRQQN